MLRAGLTILVLAGAGAAVGCSPGQQGGGPVGLMDGEASTSARVAAVREAHETTLSDPTARRRAYEDLKRIVWLAGTPEPIRLAAVEELVEFEEWLDETGSMFLLRLPTEPSAAVVEAIAREGAEREWRALAPAIVRRWVSPARKPDIDGRAVERDALEMLFPDRTVDETVFDVFATGIDGVALDEDDRRAAWDLLIRLDGDSGRVDRLLRESGAEGSGDALLGVLRRGTRELGVTPRTQEELAWLERLGGPDHAAFWADVSRAIGALDTDRRHGLEMRHLAPIVYTARFRPELLSMTSEELDSLIEQGIDGRDRAARGGDRQTLQAWRKELAWGDRLALALASEAVGGSDAARSLFFIADQDLEDSSTEHGGVVRFDEGGRLLVEHYPPRANERFGDKRFVASRDMIRGSDEALLHFHLHAQKHDNGSYAGPSGEDFANAKRLGRSSLVLTFVSSDALNVDYYQGDGAVVDLGTIRRPGG